MLGNKNPKWFIIGALALIAGYFLLAQAFPAAGFARLYGLFVVFFTVLSGYLLGSLRRDTQVWHLVDDLKRQMHEKESAQETLAKGRWRLMQQNEALATLTSRQLSQWNVPEQFFREMTEVSVNTLGVERAGIWILSEDRKIMQCVDMYHRSTGQHTSGATIRAADAPIYFQALATQRVIASADAMNAHETSEFTRDYISANGIGAMLDGTIWLNEKVVGVICHEHMGGVREWTLDEQNFVGSMADLGRLTIEAHRRRLVEAELLKHQDQLEELVRVRTLALENNASVFKFLVERAPVNVLYMDRSTKVIEINPEAELISGYTRKEAIGKTFYELFSNKQIRKHHIALFKRIVAGEKLQGLEMLMRGADGVVKEFSISASLEVDADGNPVIVSISQDMSVQKVLERSLVEAREAAESANRIKSMFVASMSHELRTPLNSIIGFLGVVLQGMSGEINAKQKDQLGRAYHSSKHLLSLITDVIDISKIEAGYLQVSIEKFDLKPLLEEVEQAVQHIAIEKNLTFTMACAKNIVLETDRKRLYQVLINIVSNGLKYTEKGGVQVSATTEKGRLIVSAKDTGIGISPEHIAHLFKPFERVESRLKIKILGTGLGLYLTKKILNQLLGGTISVESELEVGSTFTVSIPLEAPTPHEDTVFSILQEA